VGHLLQHCIARDASIVDEHLDGTDLVLDLDNALLAGDVIADVPLEYRNSGLLLKGFGGVVIAAVIGGDVVACLPERLANRGADAARTPCDQSYPSHALSSLEALCWRRTLHAGLLARHPGHQVRSKWPGLPGSSPAMT
jgi:hypothetical protein